MTTAIYPNRKADKELLEKKFPLLIESGLPNLEFFLDEKTKLATGYCRMEALRAFLAGRAK
jgi:hypothetical protein